MGSGGKLIRLSYIASLRAAWTTDLISKNKTATKIYSYEKKK